MFYVWAEILNCTVVICSYYISEMKIAMNLIFNIKFFLLLNNHKFYLFLEIMPASLLKICNSLDNDTSLSN